MGHVDDIVSNISTMTVLETDDGPVLVIGGEQASLEFHSITVDDTTGEVTLSLVDTVADGSDGATELADSESIAVEGGILVSASDNDSGVTILSTGLNPEVQTAGADTIDAGAGDDLVMGGGGDDNITGGTGNDTLYGDGAMDRNSLNWEDYTTQQVQDGFTDTIGGIDVTFSSPVETGATLAINNSAAQYTGGIEDDGTGVDPNSSFGATLSSTSSRGEYGWDFSEPVTNVSFNINDLDAGEQIQILAYDASGNPIEVILTPGSNVSVSDTNGDGIDDLASGSGSGGTADAAQSVTVTIPGPVSSIEAIHTLTSGGNIGITFTEMFFDVPVESPESGNDTIDGGDGDDLIVGGGGNDSIAGGSGADEIYGDGAEAFVFNTQAGDLFLYDPVSGTSTQLTSGLLTYGDIATTPDGTLYGVVLDAFDGSTNAAIYEIDPQTGTETLVYDLPDDFEWFNGFAADADGNLYYTDSDSQTVTRIEPDGAGGFTNPTIVYSYSGGITEMTDIAFLQDGTVLVITDPADVRSFDLDGAGNFINETNLGPISGAADLTGIIQGPDGLVYVTDINGAVYSTDPSILPLSWTTEAGTGQTNVYGIAAVPSGVGTAGNDTIDGGTGNDTIVAGEGSDTILLSDNFGDDTIFGGEDPDGLDSDTIDASGITSGGVTVTVTDESGSVVQGADSVDFSEVESFTLTNQNDSFAAFGNSDVTVDGGAGDDTFQEGSGNNSLSGGDGNDTFEVGFGTSTIDGGEGTDTLSAAASDDPISVTFDGTGFGTYDDLSDSDSGAFTSIEAVQGSSGDDIINAAADAGGVNLSGGAGDDTIAGGSGDDTIDGGAGADTLTGGSGADVFVAGGDADIITDFDATTGIDGGTSDDNDFVDLTSYYNQPNLDAWNLANPGQTYASPLGWLRADQADNGVLDQAGGLLVQDSGAPIAANELNAENTGVVCFASGTLIETPSGLIPIERLKVGDIVNSRDNGPQQIVWAGRRELTSDTLLRFPQLKPIWLSARFFGLEENLVVSPQHGVLLRLPERGGTEQLFRATHLADLQGGGARRMRGCKHVTYHHLMFETHQIIRANGFWSESLYPGKMALSSLHADSLQEIFMIFPELQTSVVEDAYGLPSAHYSKRRDLPDCLREFR